MLAGLAAAGLAAGAVVASGSGDSARSDSGPAVAGEARRGSLTVALAPAVANVKVIEARLPGRPLVVLDAGHGGHDPGATGVSGNVNEKALALTLARELRDRLAKRGRVRIALTRDGDHYLHLDQRAAIARNLGASLFLSIHADQRAQSVGARGDDLLLVRRRVRRRGGAVRACREWRRRCVIQRARRFGPLAAGRSRLSRPDDRFGRLGDSAGP